MHLRGRLVGFGLFCSGVAIFFFMYAFWRTGFASPVQPPLPPGLPPNAAFAFNPIVCAMPLLIVAGGGLLYEGVRRMIDPDDSLL